MTQGDDAKLAERMQVELCPICKRLPSIEECQPWPSTLGKAPWHVGCFSCQPREHYVGVNGNDKINAIRAWNIEAKKEASHVD